MKDPEGGRAPSLARLWPRAGWAWAYVALCAAGFLLLDVLVLMGSELARELLIFLAGMLAGAFLAFAATYPFRRIVAGVGVWRNAGVFLNLALVFGIIFGGSALAGVPAFPTSASGDAGFLIYGFAFGFGTSTPYGLGLATETAKTSRKIRHGGLSAAAVALGTVAGLFGLLFALFLIIEYAAVPLIRYLAA